MWDLFRHAGWVAWPLGVCSILGLAVILERIFTLLRLHQLEAQAFKTLLSGLEKDDTSALQDPAIAGAPITRIMNSLVVMRGTSEEAIENAALVAISMQRLRLRRYLTTLATIGSTSPFIGLFGTVLGVMAAFQALGRSTDTGEQMAAGISEALSATALGLLVAIPAVIAYNALVGRVMGFLLEIQGHTARLTPFLHPHAVVSGRAAVNSGNNHTETRGESRVKQEA